MKPNFFIVGVQKSATTSLQNYLFKHPDIYLPKQKETKFFIDNEEFSKGVKYYETKYFSRWSGEKAVGEIDPDYIYFENTIDRIASNLDIKTLKFIIVLRNPIDRAFSHYLMSYRKGFEPLTFEKAVKQGRSRIKKDDFSNFHYSYIERGYYLKQIENLMKFVDRENIMFLLMEDIKKKPLESIHEICRFLRVDDEFIPDNITSTFHKGKIPSNMKYLHIVKGRSYVKELFKVFVPIPGMRRSIKEWLLSLNEKEIPSNMVMDESVREYLYDLYSSENKRLSCFIERDLSHWS